MGRPTKFDRNAALETCMELLWEKGYENCSVKSLSEALNITRSSFYHAFGDRESLFLEVMELYAQQAPPRVLNHSTDNISIKRMLTDFFLDVCKTRSEDPTPRGCLAVNSIAELVGNHDTLGPILEESVLDRVGLFEQILSVAEKRGELPQKSNLRAQALTLENLLEGLNVMGKVIRAKHDLEAVVQQTLHGMGLYEQPAALTEAV